MEEDSVRRLCRPRGPGRRVVFLSVSSPASSVEVVSGPTFFDAGQAFRWADQMDQLYPDRSLGQQDAKDVINWFVEKIPEYASQNPTSTNTTLAPTDQSGASLERQNVFVDEFTAPLGDRTVTMRNVYRVLRGPSKEVILIAAPRDMPSVVKVERLAYTSGTAVLLDLVQVFNARPTRRPSSSCPPRTAAPEAWVSAASSTRAIWDRTCRPSSPSRDWAREDEGLSAGVTAPQNTTPGWYVQLLEQRSGQGRARSPRARTPEPGRRPCLSLSSGDQVAGLNRGIASIRLYDDGSGNPTAAGLATQGAAIERLILSLDTGSEMPSDPGRPCC